MTEDSLKESLKIIEDKRASSLREYTCTQLYKPKKFDFETARKILEKKGYGKAIKEIDELLKENSD
jgi:hypothetical protein